MITTQLFGSHVAHRGRADMKVRVLDPLRRVSSEHIGIKFISISGIPVDKGTLVLGNFSEIIKYPPEKWKSYLVIKEKGE